MTLTLALQAVAVYTSALLLSRFGAPAERRAVLLAAPALVLGLPFVSLPGGAPAVAEAVAEVAGPLASPLAATWSTAAVQEPVGAAAWGTPELLATAWALGLGLAALRLVADLFAVHRLRATARDRVGDVATSDAVTTPLVVGVVDPLILLPPSADAWTPARRAAVLAHERAHIAGRDNLGLLVAQLAACVHWFNPLAWGNNAALRRACEHRADEQALSGGADPVGYADTLVALARRAPAAGLAMARRSGLEGRVRAVLGARRPGRRLRMALGLSVLIGATGVVALLGPAAHAAPVATRAAQVDQVLAAEAEALAAAYAPEGIAIVVLDVKAGTLLGQLDRGGLLERPVAPGSVLKPFTVAAALEGGMDAATPVGDDPDIASALACSSNPGAVQIGGRVGAAGVAAMYRRVGLTPSEGSLDGLVLGQDVRVSPRRLARAWLNLAGAGAIAPEVAAEVRTMLRGVTESAHGTAPKARIPGVAVAGKTGTSQLVLADGTVDPSRHLTSFVGLAPADDPRLLVLVMVAGPQTEAPWGGTVAAPSFARITGALLN